jgi:hypothetical protein
VLRAVAVFNCWCLEIPSDIRIQHLPRYVHYQARSFRLEAFRNFYVGSGSRTPELCSVNTCHVPLLHAIKELNSSVEHGCDPPHQTFV